MIRILFLLIAFLPSFLFSNELLLTKIEKEYLNNKKTLNLCIDPNWMPYEMIKNGKHIGMTADYIKILEKYLNIKIKLVKTKTWSESLEYGKQRKCDIFSLVMPTESRLEYLDFTKPYFDIPLVVSTQIHEVFIDDISFLNNKKIGIVKDYAYVEIVRKKYPNINLFYVNNVNDGLERLKNGEYFGFIGTLYTVGYQIQNDFVGELKIAGKFDEKWELGIASRNDEPILKSIFNKAISSVPKEEKQAIFNKWLSIKYEKNYFGSMVSIILLALFIIMVILLINRKLNSEIRRRKKAEKHLKLTISSAKIGTWSWNPQTNTNDVNDIWAEILGYKKEDIKDLSDFFTLIHPEDIPLINKAFQKHLENKSEQYEVEFRMCCKDGKYKWIYSNGSIVRKDENGKPNLVVGIHQDINERKKLELEILKQKDLFIQKSRQAAMGEMLENIAHQWRQPLSVITTAASGLKISNNLNMIKSEDIDSSMDQIIRSGMYLSQTIDDFRNFLNKDRIITNVNIKKLINSAIYFYKSQIEKDKIDLVLNIDDITIEAYENELLQCLLNILNNAFDALSQNNLDKKCIIIDVYTEKNNCIISIKDNALGIKEKNLLKIFEPYFTTKHKSVGTGIGLYMTHEIITKHLLGNIEVSNTNFIYLGKNVKGACFKITLAKKMKKS
ncbi:MAG: PAS domain-containing protein [Poseidonibacter sp.]